MNERERPEARRLAVEIARQIVDGRCAPYDGARRIWRDVIPRFVDDPQAGRLHPVFIGNAREWEENPHARRQIEEQIRREAWQLISDWR